MITKGDPLDLVNEVVDAYDAFMLTDLDTHITNPAWLRLINAIHRCRYARNELASPPPALGVAVSDAVQMKDKTG